METISRARLELNATTFWFSLVGGSAICGLLAWGNDFKSLSLSMLFPLLWKQASSRVHAGIIALAYYLAAARGLPLGTQIFFGVHAPDYLGSLLWVSSSLLLTLPWYLFWSYYEHGYYWRLPFILLILILPPIGLIGWANPLTASGMLFPGFGWFGLALCLGFLIALCHPSRWSYWIIGVSLFLAVSANLLYKEPKSDWQGINTSYGGVETGTPNLLHSYARNQDLISQLRTISNTSVIIFPETLTGIWNEANDDLWKTSIATLKKYNTTVLLGAEKRISTGQFDNVLLAIGKDSGIKYVQRVPVPIAMWRPFSEHGARLHLFKSGVFNLNNVRATALICYEQLLVWPILRSMIHSPKVLIGASNAWWSKNTSIPQIQLTTLRAWSRLFGIPLITAFNE